MACEILAALELPEDDAGVATWILEDITALRISLPVPFCSTCEPSRNVTTIRPECWNSSLPRGKLSEKTSISPGKSPHSDAFRV